MTRRQPRGSKAILPQSAHSARGTLPLQEFLRELAFVLLSRGMTPKSFNELARCAFVQAAAARSKLQNGRVNHSRVAAQTGLTRADVKRLLSGGGPVVLGVTPVERVIAGWSTDRHFLRRSGLPKSLNTYGPEPSFTTLSRKYAGDVPYRAVLDELQRIGAVTVRGEEVQLAGPPELRKRHDLGFLATVTPALIDALRVASASGKVGSGASIYRLLLPIPTDLDSAFVRERCTSSAKTMIDGLSTSLNAKASGGRARRRESASFAVTVLLVENRPKKKASANRA